MLIYDKVNETKTLKLLCMPLKCRYIICPKMMVDTAITFCLIKPAIWMSNKRTSRVECEKHSGAQWNYGKGEIGFC